MIRNINKEKGFTLVELLIVVAIIGILAAIAIPQFASYREQAYCSAEKSDLANLAIAEEAHYANNDTYADLAALNGGAGFSASTNVTLTVDTFDTNSFTATADHTNCTAAAQTWDSSLGGLQ